MYPQPSGAKNLKYLFLLVLLVIVLFVGLLVIRDSRFRVTNTDPSTNSVSEYSPFFRVSLNKTLSTTGFTFSASKNLVTSHTVSNKTITFELKYPLTLGKEYVITISSVESKGGAKLTDKVFIFKPQNIQLSKEQEQALVKEQDKYSGVQNDPIIKHLPYSTLDFNLTYDIVRGSAGSEKLVLDAQLDVTQADINSGEQAAVSQYEQEVVDYIKSLGLNPNKYDIQYSY